MTSTGTTLDERLVTELRTELDHQLPAAVDLRHRLHADPRRSGDEEDTARLLIAELGHPSHAEVAGGRIVRLGAPSGRAIGLRAELDGLPVVELNDVDWAATNGCAHVCGHDVHMAALVAVIRTLRAVAIPVPLVAVFQPREESLPSGAADMITSPDFLVHELDAFIGVHLQPRMPTGTFSAHPGAINASADEFTVTVTGAGGHGGYPHVTRDPVVAAAAIVSAAQTIVSRRMDPTRPAVLTIGTITGGVSANVIASTVTMSGTIRAFDEADRSTLHVLLRDVCSASATAHGCTAEVWVGLGEPVLVNDAGLAMRAAGWIAETGLRAAAPYISCGADDFAFYAAVSRSLMVFVGVGTDEPDAPGLHHARFLPPDALVGQVAHTMLACYFAAATELNGQC